MRRYSQKQPELLHGHYKVQPKLHEVRNRGLDVPPFLFSLLPDGLLPSEGLSQATNAQQKAPHTTAMADPSFVVSGDGDPGILPAQTTESTATPANTTPRSTITRSPKTTAAPSSTSDTRASQTTDDGSQNSDAQTDSTDTTPSTTTQSTTSPASKPQSTKHSSATSTSSSNSVTTSTSASTINPISSSQSQSATPSSTQTITSATPASITSSSGPASPVTGGISKGGIIVASVSSTFALIIIVLLIVFCVRRRRLKQHGLILRDSTDGSFSSSDVEKPVLKHPRASLRGIGYLEHNIEPAVQVHPGYGSSTAAPWEPPVEQQGETSEFAVHPRGGYTRPPRTNSLNTPPVRSSARHTRRALSLSQPEQARNIRDSGQDFERRGSSDPAHKASYRRSLPSSPFAVPSSASNQQQNYHQQSPSSYQAYRPFASRYQVPSTILEEDTTSPVRRPHSTYPARTQPYILPGERTRAPSTHLPPSLAIGGDDKQPPLPSQSTVSLN